MKSEEMRVREVLAMAGVEANAALSDCDGMISTPINCAAIKAPSLP
jgi:hypothetical protein